LDERNYIELVMLHGCHVCGGIDRKARISICPGCLARWLKMDEQHFLPFVDNGPAEARVPHAAAAVAPRCLVPCIASPVQIN
jgi:hypothetical protein